MKYIGARINDEQKEMLQRIAKRKGLSVADIIRGAISFYIFGNEEPEDKGEMNYE